MDNPISWLLLLLLGGYAFFVFLRAVVRETDRREEENRREWARLYNEWREAEYREWYINEERRTTYWTRKRTCSEPEATRSLVKS